MGRNEWKVVISSILTSACFTSGLVHSPDTAGRGKGVSVLVTSSILCPPTARFSATFKSYLAELWLLLSSNVSTYQSRVQSEEFVFCTRLPEIDNSHHMWTCSCFFPISVASLFLIADSFPSPLFLSPSSQAVPKHPNLNILYHYSPTHYSDSMLDDVTQILLSEDSHHTRHCTAQKLMGTQLMFFQ